MDPTTTFAKYTTALISNHYDFLIAKGRWIKIFALFSVVFFVFMCFASRNFNIFYDEELVIVNITNSVESYDKKDVIAPSISDDVDVVNLTLLTSKLHTALNEDITAKWSNILFVKTHKCGTSSLVNTLYLFGIRRRLNFVVHTLPDNHYLDLTQGLQRSKPLTPPRPGGTYNIQCQHGVFNPEVEHTILPKETSIYTTIVRSPISHFQSAFAFWGNDRKMKKQFGKDLSYEDSINKWLDSRPTPISVTQSLNSVAMDLGWWQFPSETTVQAKIDKFIEHLSKEMDLVMITDRMDESLVLLKEKLNWNMTDILYLKRMVARQTDRKSPLSDATNEKILNYQLIDRQIFEHFNKTFETHIDNIGRDKFYNMVDEFKTLRLLFEDKCFNKNIIVGGPYGSTSWKLSEYAKENAACGFLQTRDVLITKIITQLQLSNDYQKPIDKGEFIDREIIEKIQRDWENGRPSVK